MDDDSTAKGSKGKGNGGRANRICRIPNCLAVLLNSKFWKQSFAVCLGVSPNEMLLDFTLSQQRFRTAIL
ncbi:MAG: hypothetical protein ACK53X_00675 [Holosporales bacterium]